MFELLQFNFLLIFASFDLKVIAVSALQHLTAQQTIDERVHSGGGGGVAINRSLNARMSPTHTRVRMSSSS